MSISPAQIVQQAASAGSASEKQSSNTAVSLAALSGAAKASEPKPPPAGAAPPVQFTTDLQIDNHHQIYYEVVDDSTGAVLLEIPSEALRKIGESLNLPLEGESNAPTVDLTF